MAVRLNSTLVDAEATVSRPAIIERVRAKVPTYVNERGPY